MKEMRVDMRVISEKSRFNQNHPNKLTYYIKEKIVYIPPLFVDNYIKDIISIKQGGN